MSSAATPEGKLSTARSILCTSFSLSPEEAMKQPISLLCPIHYMALRLLNTANLSIVLWAQRSSKTDAAKNFIYVTITVPDVQPANLKLDLKPQKLTFSGHSDSLKRDYHVELEFYAEIDEKESKVNHTAKNVELVLRKKELKEEFWPRLLKDAKKVHFLKTDFDKWVDEDEQDEAPEDDLGKR